MTLLKSDAKPLSSRNSGVFKNSPAGCPFLNYNIVASAQTIFMESQKGGTGAESSGADNNANSEELFQIIDESGEGFGFDLTPEALARPLLLGTSALFGVGILAGIPIGIAMGRSEEPSKRVSSGAAKGAQVKPTLDGVKFAASAFGLGTLLCAGIGVSAFYAVKTYYDVDSFEEFGQIMQHVVSDRRIWIEKRVSPILGSVRSAATENLPEPVQRLQHRFGESRFGRWIKDNVQSSVNIVSEEELSRRDLKFNKIDSAES